MYRREESKRSESHNVGILPAGFPQVIEGRGSALKKPLGKATRKANTEANTSVKPNIVGGLVGAYRRRAFFTTAGVSLLTLGLSVGVVGAQTTVPAQAQPAPAAQASPPLQAAPPKSAASTGTTGAAKKKQNPSAKTGAKSRVNSKSTPANADKNAGMTLHIVPIQRGNQGGVTRSAAPPITPAGNITIAPAAIPSPTSTMITFNYIGSDIVNVLKFYSQASGLTIAADPSLSGQVTIINPKQVTIDDAFKILQSVLAVRGFTAVQNGNVLSIVPFELARTSTSILNPGVNEEGETKVDSRNQFMTQVIPLENVDADSLSRELAPLISKGASLIGSNGSNALILTDNASNVQKFLLMVEALDKKSNQTELKTYPLRRAEASAIADIINNLYKQITTRGRGGQPQPGQQFQPPQPGQPQPGGPSRPAVVAVADIRTNSVIVVASSDTQDRIATDIISRLDDDDTNTLTTKIVKIKYADAVQVANLVSNVLTNSHAGSAAGGQSGQSFQQRAFGGFDPFGGGGQQQQPTASSADPFGKVIADPRTNSILITASTDRMKLIENLIEQLDRDVPVEPTTFVFPLKNAQADDVAYALGQAFGTSNSNNSNSSYYNFGGGGNGNGSSKRQPIQRRLSATSNTNPFGRSAARRGLPPGPPNAPGNDGTNAVSGSDPGAAEGVAGVMTADGFVPAEDVNGTDANGNKKPTRQFGRYYGGYGYGNNTRSLGQSGGPQFGRGREGGYANLLQLQNNVFVTASPNGDNLIVTTTPDNYEAVRQIIESLDVVARQVLIEVVVAEVTLDTDQKLGFSLSGALKNLIGGSNTANGQINLQSPGSSSSFDPLAAGTQFVLSSSNYTALLQAISADSKVKVLATPRVFTSNNQQAEIDIVTKIPYITGQTSGGFSSLVSTNVEYLPVGFQLTVTPRITRQGLVTIDVLQDATDLLRYQTLGVGANANPYPVTNDRTTDTSVTIQDGETVVIGGLIRDNRTLNTNKIPILGDIPILGQFFRSRELTRSKTELMIFMTPHVVNSVAEARELTRNQAMPLVKQIPDLGKQHPNLKFDVKVNGKSVSGDAADGSTPIKTKKVKPPKKADTTSGDSTTGDKMSDPTDKPNG